MRVLLVKTSSLGDVLALARRTQLDRLTGRVETLRIAQQVIHCPFDHGWPAIEAQIRLGKQLHRLLGCRHRGVFLHRAEQRIEIDLFGAGLIGIDPGQSQDFADQRFQSVALTGQAWTTCCATRSASTRRVNRSS